MPLGKLLRGQHVLLSVTENASRHPQRRILETQILPSALDLKLGPDWQQIHPLPRPCSKPCQPPVGAQPLGHRSPERLGSWVVVYANDSHDPVRIEPFVMHLEPGGEHR